MKTINPGWKDKIKDTHFLILLIAAIIILGYILPSIIFSRPFGTDVYTHMVFTKYMYETTSLDSFYNQLEDDPGSGELGLGYPYGLWLFGSIVAKVLGVEPYKLVNIIPIMIIIGISLLYIKFSYIFLQSKRNSLISTAFLLSMPLISIMLLRYRSSVFTTLALITILYINQKDNIRLRKNIPLTALCVFSLCVSHAGTFIFLIAFVILYAFLKSLLWGLFQRRMYSLLTIMLIVYVITMNIFPSIHTQYLTKSLFFVEITETLSGMIGFTFPIGIGEIFYQEIFANKNIIHALMWSTVFYAICKLTIFTRQTILKKIKDARHGHKLAATIPIFGSFKNLSHSVLTTPLWSGPIQMLLSIPGYFKLNIKGKCMVLTLIIITLIPAALHTGATGALRQIYYLLLILPISAAAGLSILFEYSKKYSHKKITSFISAIILMGVFSSTLIIPIVGNIYYLPPTSGAEHEILGLGWMKDFGQEDEKIIAYGYRHMVDVYSGKSTPQVSSGTQTVLYLQNLLNTFFSPGATAYTDGLYFTFRGNYIVSSEKIIRNLNQMDQLVRGRKTLNYEEPGEVYLDSNTGLDRIYSGKNDFTIYQYIPPVIDVKKTGNDTKGLSFNEKPTIIKDAGIVFLIQTDTYSIHVDKKTPKIEQLDELSERNVDFIKEGYMRDHLFLGFLGGPRHGDTQTFYLNDLLYEEVEQKDDGISYKTTLKNSNEEHIATLQVIYTFHQDAIKKQVIISNDQMASKNQINLNLQLFNTHYSPDLQYFSYYNPQGEKQSKTIYPSDDMIKLEDQIFNNIYFHNNDSGIYYSFDDTSTYPEEIRYRGSTIYNYQLASLGSKSIISSGETMQFTQYISVGSESEAKTNIDKYAKFKKYPFKNGKKPIVLIGYSSYDEDPITVQRFNTYRKFNARNATYMEGKPFDSTSKPILKQIQENANLVGYIRLISGGEYLNFSTQQDEILNMYKQIILKNLSVKGIIPYALDYNLDTISVISSSPMDYLVRSPEHVYYGPYYRNGGRNINYAHLAGEQTELLLIPISLPLGDKLDLSNPDKVLSQWKRIVDSSTKNDDLTVFYLPPEKLTGGLEDYILEFTEYATKKGLVFSTLDEISTHYNQINNVHTTVSQNKTWVKITARNNNNKQITGLTYHLWMPQVAGGCSYATSAGIIERNEIGYGGCNIYVSVDIPPKSTSNLRISAS